MFLAKDKNPYPFTYILSLGSIEYLYLITIVKFILSSISNGWLFWSVNHTIISSYSELNVFKNIWFVGDISNRLPNGLFGTKCTIIIIYSLFIVDIFTIEHINIKKKKKD